MPPIPNHPPLITPQGSSIYYSGADASQGPQPAVIFFALSAIYSLYQDPYNQSGVELTKSPIRVFSWDLPFHEINQDPNEAIYKWALEFSHRPHFISDFIDLCMQNVDYLINQNLVDPTSLGVSGLSRGAYMATHLAARDQRIKTLLGFAPFTEPKLPPELAYLASTVSTDTLALKYLVDHLVDKQVRFYIGNHDTRVGTEACFEFIKTLVDTSVAQGVRSPPVEMIIYPSIGHRGHGTPPQIFQDGAAWIKTQLLK